MPARLSHNEAKCMGAHECADAASGAPWRLQASQSLAVAPPRAKVPATLLPVARLLVARVICLERECLKKLDRLVGVLRWQHNSDTAVLPGNHPAVGHANGHKGIVGFGIADGYLKYQCWLIPASVHPVWDTLEYGPTRATSPRLHFRSP